MIDYRSGRKLAGDVGEVLRENSIPLALVGAGIGWFLVSSLSGGGDEQRRPRGRQGGQQGTAGPRAANDAGQQSRSGRSSDFAQRARGAAQSAYETVRGTAGQWGEYAGDHAQRVYSGARRTFGDMVEEQPLLLGAAGLIIGAALGASLPTTRYENEMVGETRDDLARSVKEYGREQWERAQQVVERTVETVRDEAEKQGFSMDSARDVVDEVRARATNVAQAAAGAVREAVEGGGTESKAGSGSGARDDSRGNDTTSPGRPAQPGGGAEVNRGNDTTSGGPARRGPGGTNV